MNSLARSIAGVAVTAAAVYFMDPANGRRRRLMVTDQCRRTARRLDRDTRDFRHDASEQARYLAARTKAAFGNGGKSDKTVSKLTRGAVQHAVSHPEDIAVAVDHGHVILRGTLLPYEHQRLLDDVRAQPGVMIVTDHLSEHRGNGEYSVDTGRTFKAAARRSGWSTTGRVLASCAGGALLFWGVRERKALGEFGVAVAEELRHAMERNLKEGVDAAKETVGDAEENLDKATRTAAEKVEKGADWAESAGSDVIEEYAQKRRRKAAATDGADTAH